MILEVLDARDPLGCRCPQVEQAVIQSGANKKIVLVLNKIGKTKLNVHYFFMNCSLCKFWHGWFLIWSQIWCQKILWKNGLGIFGTSFQRSLLKHPPSNRQRTWYAQLLSIYLGMIKIQNPGRKFHARTVSWWAETQQRAGDTSDRRASQQQRLCRRRLPDETSRELLSQPGHKDHHHCGRCG